MNIEQKQPASLEESQGARVPTKALFQLKRRGKLRCGTPKQNQEQWMQSNDINGFNQITEIRLKHTVLPGCKWHACEAKNKTDIRLKHVRVCMYIRYVL